MTTPRYQDIAARDVPEVVEDDGTRVRVVCGSFWGRRGPVEGVAADPSYVDITVPPGKRRTFEVDTRRNAFAYVFQGSGSFRDASEPRGVLTDTPGPVENVVREPAGDRSLVLFDAGDEIVVQAGEHGMRFLLVSGKPIQEPVALVRADRHEHARGVAPGGRGPRAGHVHPAGRMNRPPEVPESKGRTGGRPIAGLAWPSPSSSPRAWPRWASSPRSRGRP
jgi:hypothetical protein